MIRSRAGVVVLLACALLALASANAIPAEVSAAPAVANRAATTPSARVDAARSDHVKAARGKQKWRSVEKTVATITGPDGDLVVDIDARLYIPRNATRRTPQPAILMTHGFGGSKDNNETLSTAEFFAAHGYVVLTYSASGFGSSGGCITLQSSDYDVKIARQLIDKVLDPRRFVEHDRKGVVVGTIGGSYGGGIQLPLAARDHRIRATIPGRTWGNLAYSLVPNNYIAPGDRTGLSHELNGQGVFKFEWTSLFFALGNTQPAMGNGGCPQAKAASGDPDETAAGGPCLGFYLDVCRIYAKLTSQGTTDRAGRRYVAKASVPRVMKRIKAPTLLVQGQSDSLFNLNDASSTYLALKRRGVPVSMIWNSGGHGGYTSQPGECEAYDGVRRSVKEMDHCYLSVRSLHWMNHWLRGKGKTRGPSFTYYRDWVDYRGSGVDDEQYGVGRFRHGKGGTVYALSGTDELTKSGAAVAGSATMVNPPGGLPAAYTESSNFTGPDASPSAQDVPPSEIEGQFAQFTTAPFARNRVSVGIPTAHLDIANTGALAGQDLVFFAKLYDVAPNGSAELIHRLIAPVRVPAAAVGKPVDFALAGFAHRFDAGHSAGLVLCTTDATSYNAKIADVLTVTTGPRSLFRLP
ncbi:hypothetical protein BH09ACT12_BH09ACT12_20120 [soil metagenome]